MIAKTYEEWKLAGYQVIRGQKAYGWTAKGLATFLENQVKRPEKSMWKDIEYDEDAEYTMDMDAQYNYDGYFDDIGDR